MSNPAALTAASTTSGTTGSTSSGLTSAATAAPSNPPSRGALPLADYVIHAQTFNSDSNWPVDLVLDSAKANWQEWDRRLRLIVDHVASVPT
jgi:hypothetical protein